MWQTKYAVYLKIWEGELIFGRAGKAISSPGVRSPCSMDPTILFPFEQLEQVLQVLQVLFAYLLLFRGLCFVLSEHFPNMDNVYVNPFYLLILRLDLPRCPTPHLMNL